MDYFAKYNQEAWELKHNIVNGMREVIKEKGYAIANKPLKLEGDGKEIEIDSDRILVDGWHTDNLSVEKLLEALHACYHILPNFANFGY
jgi:hypothetical protein